MLNHHSLIDQSFANQVSKAQRKVQREVNRRKQSCITNKSAYIAHLWVRWLNVSVLGKGE